MHSRIIHGSTNYLYSRSNSYFICGFVILMTVLGCRGKKLEEISLPAETTIRNIQLIKQHPEPVISTRHPDASDNRFGFEGGTAVKVGDTYHIFTSEMIDDPVWVKMRFGHWKSKDKINWKRVRTVKESSGNFDGTDPRASLWSPMVVFDSVANRWNLFYVAYHSEPSTETAFLLNHSGRIWHAVSDKPGLGGIDGNFKDVGIIMKPDENTQSWEGLQGVDSFYPWKVDGNWHAFYGSATTDDPKGTKWQVGMARSTSGSLKGPWVREPQGNPSTIESTFIENPIVHHVPNVGWFCAYDSQGEGQLGWSFSKDGTTWETGKRLVVQPTAEVWSADVRTFLGAIPEGDNRYTFFYTGFEEMFDWPRMSLGIGKETCGIGFVEVTLELSEE